MMKTFRMMSLCRKHLFFLLISLIAITFSIHMDRIQLQSNPRNLQQQKMACRYLSESINYSAPHGQLSLLVFIIPLLGLFYIS